MNIKILIVLLLLLNFVLGNELLQSLEEFRKATLDMDLEDEKTLINAVEKSRECVKYI